MIDVHTHLFFPEVTADLDGVVTRAKEAGVQYMINVGTNVQTSEKCVALADKFDFMYATAGIHPTEAEIATTEYLYEIEELLKHPKVLAIGEIGLDYYHKEVSTALQRQTLTNFFKMAERHKKPIVLHIRDAYEDIIQMLQDFFQPPIRGMSHCFSGTPDHMEQLVQLGLHISFAGPVTYPKNDLLREAAKNCPIQKILTETDSPYLPPQSRRGKRNEPAFMRETASVIAELKGMTLDEFSKRTIANARNLFKF